eukprot:s404_g6.t1
MQKARGSLKGEGGSNPDELAAGWDTGLETPFAAKAETPARRMAKANNTNENVPYVPNVAYEIHIRGEFPLKGIIIGNGVYSGLIQNPTVPEFAYNQGLIDEHQLLAPLLCHNVGT